MTAPVTYTPAFLEPDFAWRAFEKLRNELTWERREDAPRSEYWWNSLGRSYTYGRGRGERTYKPQREHPIIQAINVTLGLNTMDRLYEGCFLNMYEDGRDALGWHSDDDPGIDHSRPIAVVTLGNARDIQFKRMPFTDVHTSHCNLGEYKGVCKYGKDETCPALEPAETVRLQPGSLLLMHAGMQDTHLHRIPRAGYECGPRISLTFRGLLS